MYRIYRENISYSFTYKSKKNQIKIKESLAFTFIPLTKDSV